MKYYHVIYNSSQRTLSGAPGLGVRTCTEGTPGEYIQILDQNGCFGYESGSIAQPTPKALLENGNLILDMPVTYSYVKLFVPSTNKEIYVYLRTVCVGFDYPYYVKFTAARMDNFVTDAYIFEEYPGTEVSQIFYEKPAAGSVSFVPQSPVPSPDNEVMKELSVGQQPLLPIEEKPFVCESLPSFNDGVVELLLGYFEANRKNIPLLVKCEPSAAPVLMANLIRLLPVQLESNATFMTNYQIEGVKDGYKVFFINEGYQFEYESTGQFQILDLTQGQTVNTTEADLYRNTIKEYLNSSDKASLDKLSTWLLSSIYSTIRQNSPEVKSVMYNYVIEPSEFTLNSLVKNCDELWPVMVAYFKKNAKNQTLLNEHLEAELVSKQEPANKANLLNLFNKMVAAGFSIEFIAAKVKKEVSSRLLSAPDYLAAVLTGTKGIKSLSQFIDKKMFEEKNEYLDTTEMTPWWADTYRVFYTPDSLNKSQIVSRMLVDEVKTEDIEKVLASLMVTDNEVCSIFANVLEKHKSEVTRTWPIIEKSLNAIIASKGIKPAPDVDTVVQLNDFIITPLSLVQCMTSWQELMIIWSGCKTGSINEKNVSSLLDCAIKLRSQSTIQLMLNKGLPYMKENDYSVLCSAVKDVLTTVTPESLLLKADKCGKNKVSFIGAVHKTYEVKLKVIEKLVEIDENYLSEKEMEEVRVKIYGKKPSKSKKTKSKDEPEDGSSQSFIDKVLGFFKKR